jgi:hypothetical protein
LHQDAAFFDLTITTTTASTIILAACGENELVQRVSMILWVVQVAWDMVYSDSPDDRNAPHLDCKPNLEKTNQPMTPKVRNN